MQNILLCNSIQEFGYNQFRFRCPNSDIILLFSALLLFSLKANVWHGHSSSGITINTMISNEVTQRKFPLIFLVNLV